jgi:hypothetical protein
LAEVVCSEPARGYEDSGMNPQNVAQISDAFSAQKLRATPASANCTGPRVPHPERQATSELGIADDVRNSPSRDGIATSERCATLCRAESFMFAGRPSCIFCGKTRPRAHCRARGFAADRGCADR